MNFRTWLERNFLEPAIPDDIEDFVNNMQVPPTVPTKVQRLGLIYIRPRTSPIAMNMGNQVIVFATNPALMKNNSADGMYDSNNHAVYLNYNILNDRDKTKSVLTHELIHSEDPKLQIKKSHDWDAATEWSPAFPKQKPYHRRPAEFDAFGGQIAHLLRSNLSTLTPEERSNAIAHIKGWLRRGSPIDEFPFRGFIGALRAWKESPRLWRIFQQRMYSFLNSMEQSSPNTIPQKQ
jgi:hypothetical protein